MDADSRLRRLQEVAKVDSQMVGNTLIWTVVDDQEAEA